MMRRKPTAKPLSELLPSVLKTSLEQHGLATSQIITRWREIAGDELAAVTRPLRINWPRVKGEDGEVPKHQAGATLVLMVESGFALDVQHAAPLILQRVNALFGWAAVAKITLRQGPVCSEEKNDLNQHLSGEDAPIIPLMEDENLQKALQKLGQNVVNSKKT